MELANEKLEKLFDCSMVTLLFSISCIALFSYLEACKSFFISLFQSGEVISVIFSLFFLVVAALGFVGFLDLFYKVFIKDLINFIDEIIENFNKFFLNIFYYSASYYVMLSVFSLKFSVDFFKYSLYIENGLKFLCVLRVIYYIFVENAIKKK